MTSYYVWVESTEYPDTWYLICKASLVCFVKDKTTDSRWTALQFSWDTLWRDAEARMSIQWRQRRPKPVCAGHRGALHWSTTGGRKHHHVMVHGCNAIFGDMSMYVRAVAVELYHGIISWKVELCSAPKKEYKNIRWFERTIDYIATRNGMENASRYCREWYDGKCNHFLPARNKLVYAQLESLY